MNHPDFVRLKKLVEDNLEAFIPDVDDKSHTLREAMAYSLLSGGKRLRPVLLLATAELCGCDARLALPYASAVEFIHTYSLIHDDLPAMDDDELRRGKPTNHMVFGEAAAILAGDGLLTAAFEAMTRDVLLYFEDPTEIRRRFRVIHELAKAAGCQKMLAGQIADLESEGKVCSQEMLEYIYINKTAALITAAVRSGAWLGLADTKTLEALTVYGESFGLAFQIVDDLLDVRGDASITGKISGRDKHQNKSTFVAQYGEAAAEERIRELTDRALAALASFDDKGDFLRYVAKTMMHRIM